MWRTTVLFVALITAGSASADFVPYAINSIRALGDGFIELVGPGRYAIEGTQETQVWNSRIVVRASSIKSLQNVEGVDNACVAAYATDGYSEDISIRAQSCDEVLEALVTAED